MGKHFVTLPVTHSGTNGKRKSHGAGVQLITPGLARKATSGCWQTRGEGAVNPTLGDMGEPRPPAWLSASAQCSKNMERVVWVGACRETGRRCLGEGNDV